MTQTELAVVGAAGGTLVPETFAPAGVRGADKAAQRFLYFLLTPAGTVPGRPGDGSPFLELARQFRSEFDVFAAFQAAYPAAAAGCRAAELPADPPAERFGAARVAGLAIGAAAVTVTLELTAADGSAPTRPVDFTLEV